MLVLSPFVLLAGGLLVARVAKARRVWRRHSLLTVNAGFILIVMYTVASLGMLLGTPRAATMGAAVGIDAPTAFFFGSGVLDIDVAWPVEDRRLMALAIVSFMLYPFWYWLGLNAGFWLFGRSPKQTGILGLLR